MLFVVLLAVWGWCLAGYMILTIHDACTYSPVDSYAESFKFVRDCIFGKDRKVGYAMSVLMSPLGLLVTLVIHYVDATEHAREQKRLAQDQRDEDARVLRDAKLQYELGYKAGKHDRGAWSDAWEGSQP